MIKLFKRGWAAFNRWADQPMTDAEYDYYVWLNTRMHEGI